jgi:two-component system chemotaxis response regulator CheB
MAGVRDIVVIGGSAGAVEGMLRVAERLPARLGASVFLVIHLPPAAPSVLPRILERHGPLRSRHPCDGECFACSVIYVAPPDQHLLVRAAHVDLVHGPRENGHRPAIDPLFRSASEAHLGRVIAVVLSGNLDDGAAGLRAVVDAGGAAIVQDPRTALYPSMPRSALARVPEAEAVPLRDIAARVVDLVGSPVPGAPTVTPVRRQLASAVLDPTELDILAS